MDGLCLFVFFVSFMYFTTKVSVTCNPLLLVVRDSLSFVHFIQDTYEDEWRNSYKGSTSNYFLLGFISGPDRSNFSNSTLRPFRFRLCHTSYLMTFCATYDPRGPRDVTRGEFMSHPMTGHSRTSLMNLLISLVIDREFVLFLLRTRVVGLTFWGINCSVLHLIRFLGPLIDGIYLLTRPGWIVYKKKEGEKRDTKTLFRIPFLSWHNYLIDTVSCLFFF